MIVFQKIYSRRIYATALKLLLYFRPHNTIYDIDDAEYEKFPAETIKYFMSNCSYCTVGSQVLMNYAKQFNTNVVLLTSPVIAHDEIKITKNKVFTVGWIGFYNAHRDSLQQLFLPALVEVDFPVKLILMGVTNPEHIDEITAYYAVNSNVIIEIEKHINWYDELSIYNKIKTFDIGIAPLLDNEINRAKSAFKLKQYMSCAVPVLGSQLGENSRYLINGKNGFFCNTPKEYEQKLKHIRNMTLEDYTHMQDNALCTVEQFNMKGYCATLMTLFTQLQVQDVHTEEIHKIHIAK